MDNYVDGVDRTVNMHQSGRNIYTTMRMLFSNHPACVNRFRCKIARHDFVIARTPEHAFLTEIAHPPRNNSDCAALLPTSHVIV